MPQELPTAMPQAPNATIESPTLWTPCPKPYPGEGGGKEAQKFSLMILMHEGFTKERHQSGTTDVPFFRTPFRSDTSARSRRAMARGFDAKKTTLGRGGGSAAR